MRALVPVAFEVTLEILLHIHAVAVNGECHHLQTCRLPCCLLVPVHVLHLRLLLGAGQLHRFSLPDHGVQGLADSTSCGERDMVEEECSVGHSGTCHCGEVWAGDEERPPKAGGHTRLQNHPKGDGETPRPPLLLTALENQTLDTTQEGLGPGGAGEAVGTGLCHLCCLCKEQSDLQIHSEPFASLGR